MYNCNIYINNKKLKTTKQQNNIISQTENKTYNKFIYDQIQTQL